MAGTPAAPCAVSCWRFCFQAAAFSGVSGPCLRSSWLGLVTNWRVSGEGSTRFGAVSTADPCRLTLVTRPALGAG